MNNAALAQVFANIGDLLEIKGENKFKIIAYRRAAETLREHNREVRVVWQEGGLRAIPGVGAAIADKIDELLTTGRLGFYERLKEEIPPGLIEVMAVPDLGPKKAALFWKELDITSVPALEAAARAGKLRALPGMGEKSEAKILAGIESLARRATGRRPLGQAWSLAQDMLAFLRGLAGVEQAEAAGSLRRYRATIGDLDFLAAANAPGPIMDAFCAHPSVARVLGHGPTKSSVEFANGLQADLRVLPQARFGTLLQYFTGSKDHNVKLRELALKQGLSLSEHALTRADGSEILCATEAEVYAQLGLDYIPPELREDRGEIEAAAKHALPRLVELGDLRSDLHAHTTWSDGALSIHAMALAAQARGRVCLAITDHSQSLGVTGGLTPERLREQRLEINREHKRLGGGFTLLQGAEVEIRADGRLDYADSDLAALDIVVASLHTSLRQPREQVTQRLLNAVNNPHVDIIGHPTGRLFPDREGADLALEAVLRAAAASGVALEINANPARLDLDDAPAYRALELGCLLAINTDAHAEANFDLAHFGVGIARRAWATPDQVINTWPLEKLRAWLASRGPGGAARLPVISGAPALKKTAAKKAAAKKSSSKKAAPKQVAAKKPVAKKAAPKRAAGKQRPRPA
ncbi:MAG: DNA polymerase/3'-5' exonuclease PolX [Anaerolineales bacterium]|nr:DNA polymerase/3'-5' exonuclease PolX [Anaerolineales bacterium]